MSEPEIKPERRGGYRPGAGRPKGAKSARPRNAREKDIYRLARIEKLLEDAREGRAELSKSQQFAIDQEYAKLKPSLSSVEQTLRDERDNADPQQLLTQLAAMFAEKPGLFEQVVALRQANAAQQSEDQSADKHVKH